MYIIDQFSLNNQAKLIGEGYAKINNYDFLLPEKYIPICRRLSRQMRMGVFSVLQVDQSMEEIKAIIISIGSEGQESFSMLNNIFQSDHGIINPTMFSLSTHNALAGFLAIMLKNNGYNTNYIGNMAFENGLIDAIYTRHEYPILLGAVDELSDKSIEISDCSHSVISEGSQFFLLSPKNDLRKAKALIKNIQIVNDEPTLSSINSFLKQTNTDIANIDLILCNNNIDLNCDQKIFNYETLCGQYPTSISFALWLGAELLMPNIENRLNSVVTIFGYATYQRILICRTVSKVASSYILLKSC